jgi:hypothetical protein
VLHPESRRPPRWLLAALLLSPGAPGVLRAQEEPPQLLSITGGKSEPGGDSLPGLQKKAAAGNPRACLQLGVIFETGDGVKQDYVQARRWYEAAAAGGAAEAIYRLGRFYQEGFGVDPDPVRAYQLYRLAALADVPLAQYNLGAMLVSARGVPRDDVDGFAWLILAAHHQVAPEGEQRVRAHLADRPQFIAAAESRAAELRKAIEARRGTKPPWPPPADDSDLPAAGVSTPPREKPRFDAPKMEPPKIQPAPAISPPVLPATGAPATPGT